MQGNRNTGDSTQMQTTEVQLMQFCAVLLLLRKWRYKGLRTHEAGKGQKWGRQSKQVNKSDKGAGRKILGPIYQASFKTGKKRLQVNRIQRLDGKGITQMASSQSGKE